MTELYLRKVQVAVEGGRTWTYDGTLPESNADGRTQVPGLHIRFRTQQKDASTPNVARIDIYNVSPSSVAATLMTGKQVTLSAGYGDGPAHILFKGQIRQARANVRDDTMDPDSYLAILATDSSQARNFAVVNKSLSAGHTYYDQVMVCADALKELGVEVGYIDKDRLTKTQFSRGYAAHGMAKSLLREVCNATKTSWSIQNGVFQVVANDKLKPGSTIALNGRTGLIGQAVQTIGGIEGKSLLNGLIVPTSTVQIDNGSIQRAEIDPSIAGEPNNQLLAQYGALSSDGTYKVFYASHEGETRGNPFYTSFVAVSAAVGVVPPQYASRGVSLPNY
ncbi:hypothetical protein MKK88_16200 [Methylobacterium sp. E-005]|uniref:hypothetical protein n=1 Tax=Methylobacterium sp. E-005 TaxID=2836549 RepID=UPI001FBBD857|nr:hypothetical protein [Methylobacterium sp. E-005]MCJ2087511.1 hypothetical protein [Methylobacterium sp. E-005]